MDSQCAWRFAGESTPTDSYRRMSPTGRGVRIPVFFDRTVPPGAWGRTCGFSLARPSWPIFFQTEMKPPRSLKMTDDELGTGRPCVPGDLAICHCTCSRRKGDIVFASDPQIPYRIRVGARNCCVGIEYGLLGMRIGGRRTILVPPNLTYQERKIYHDIPAGALLVYVLRLIELPEKWDAEMEFRLGRELDD